MGIEPNQAEKTKKVLKIRFADLPPPNTLGSHSLNPSQVVFFVRFFFIKKKPRKCDFKPIETDQTQSSWFPAARVCHPDPLPQPQWSQPSLVSPLGSRRPWAHTTSPLLAAMVTAAQGRTQRVSPQPGRAKGKIKALLGKAGFPGRGPN